MSNSKPDIRDLTTVLVHINGPMDEDINKTAKFKHEQYEELKEKLYKQELRYNFSDTDKEIAMDALRMFLEGIMDADVDAVTGNSKDYYLSLYASLIKEWGISMPKLKRQSYDSLEYQEKAKASDLLEN
jgi:hypothetical protein